MIQDILNYEITADYIKMPLKTRYKIWPTHVSRLDYSDYMEASTLTELFELITKNNKMLNLVYEYSKDTNKICQFNIEKIIYGDLSLFRQKDLKSDTTDYTFFNKDSNEVIIFKIDCLDELLAFFKSDIFLAETSLIELNIKLNLELEAKKEKDRVNHIAENNRIMWQLLEKKRLAGDFKDFESGNYNSTEITQSIY